MKYKIIYSYEAINHLKKFTAREQRIILDSVDKQLSYQPKAETKNRKQMRPNPIAPWELRPNKIRVYYDPIDKPKLVVNILAIGIKKIEKVIIDDKEIKL